MLSSSFDDSRTRDGPKAGHQTLWLPMVIPSPGTPALSVRRRFLCLGVKTNASERWNGFRDLCIRSTSRAVLGEKIPDALDHGPRVRGVEREAKVRGP